MLEIQLVCKRCQCGRPHTTCEQSTDHISLMIIISLDATQSHPLYRMYFGQYQILSAMLQWPEDGTAILCTERSQVAGLAQKAGRISSKAPSLCAAALGCNNCHMLYVAGYILSVSTDSSYHSNRHMKVLRERSIHVKLTKGESIPDRLPNVHTSTTCHVWKQWMLFGANTCNDVRCSSLHTHIWLLSSCYRHWVSCPPRFRKMLRLLAFSSKRLLRYAMSAISGLKYSGLLPPWDSGPNHPSSWGGLTVASMHCDQWVARSGPAFHRAMWFIDCSHACRWTIHITITFVSFLFSLRNCEMLR